MCPYIPIPGFPADFTPQVTEDENGKLPVVVTVSDSWTVPFTCRSSAVGFTDTVRGGGSTVTATEHDIEVYAALVPATVTVLGEGGTWGAVYRPPAEIVPTEELPPVTPFTVQLTAVLVVPAIVGVN
jgi:hypothetical protein